MRKMASVPAGFCEKSGNTSVVVLNNVAVTAFRLVAKRAVREQFDSLFEIYTDL
jgi:hypothetical protein